MTWGRGGAVTPDGNPPGRYASFTDRWHADLMFKGCFNAATAAVIASLLDRHFCDNRHIDAALAILRQIGHGLGF